MILYMIKYFVLGKNPVDYTICVCVVTWSNWREQVLVEHWEPTQRCI